MSLLCAAQGNENTASLAVSTVMGFFDWADWQYTANEDNWAEPADANIALSTGKWQVSIWPTAYPVGGAGAVQLFIPYFFALGVVPFHIPQGVIAGHEYDISYAEPPWLPNLFQRDYGRLDLSGDPTTGLVVGGGSHQPPLAQGLRIIHREFGVINASGDSVGNPLNNVDAPRRLSFRTPRARLRPNHELCAIYGAYNTWAGSGITLGFQLAGTIGYKLFKRNT